MSDVVPEICAYENLARAHVRAMLGSGLPTALKDLSPEVMVVVTELCVGFYGDGLEAGFALTPYATDTGANYSPADMMAIEAQEYLLGFNDGRRQTT